MKYALVVRGIEKQMALAFDLDVHQSAITRWKEDGPISIASASRLCEVLDISLDWLVLGRGFIEQHKVQAGEPFDDPDMQRFRRMASSLPRHVTLRLLELAEAVSDSIAPDAI